MKISNQYFEHLKGSIQKIQHLIFTLGAICPKKTVATRMRVKFISGWKWPKELTKQPRLWLEYVFSQAAICATDENTIEWLESAVGGSAMEEPEIIVRLIGTDSSDETEANADQDRQRKQEQLQTRIKQLDAFSDFSRALREVLVSELNGLIADVEKMQK